MEHAEIGALWAMLRRAWLDAAEAASAAAHRPENTSGAEIPPPAGAA
jgi:hypothetical protein